MCVLCKTKIPGCLNCQDSENCLSCFENYLNPITKTCLTTCESGFYADAESHSCLLCNTALENCVECQSKDVCTNCEHSKLVDGKCKGCQTNEYFDEDDQQCKQCNEQCKTCNGNENSACTSCYPHYYLSNSQCYECHESCYECVSFEASACTSCNSPSHLNNNQAPNYCCDESCKTCTYYSSTSCSSCISDYVYYENECIEECPPGYYFSLSSNICRKCSYFCKTCDRNSYTCTSCEEGMYLDNFACNYCQAHCIKCDAIDKCDECAYGYVSYGNGVCDCKHGCKTCYIHEESKEERCLSCWDGNYYNQDDGTCNQCVDYCKLCDNGTSCNECKDGSYQNETTTLCIKCHSGCKTCFGPDENNCLSCNDGKFWLESTQTCLEKCPDTYYGNNNNNKCESCYENCQTCYNSSSDSCYTCIEGFHINNTELTGIQYCCSDTCNSCNGPLETNCLTCASELYLYQYNSSCLTECPSHYYEDNNTICCEKCAYICKECDGPNENQCTDCYDGTYLIEGECKCHDNCLTCNGPLNNNCLSCITGKFLNDNFECEQCEIQCQICKNNKSYCMICADTYYYFNHACLKNCPDHYYKNENLMICSECHSTCSQCSGPNSYQCTVCNSESIPPRHKSNNSQQEDYCCLPECKTCKGITNSSCLSCYDETYLYNNECLTECPASYYEEQLNNKCELCDYICKTCDQSATSCTSCYNGTVLFEETNECKCDSSCKTCKGKTNSDCLSCFDRFYYDNSHCYACSEECFSCETNASNCLSCEPGSKYYFYLNTCIDQCPEQYFENSNNQKCDECHYSCKNCSGEKSYQCTECYTEERILYKLNDTNQYCCHSDCETCKGPTQYQCLSCKENFLYNGECISSCPDYYYDFKDTKTCMQCHETCKSCINDSPDNCTSCANGLVLTLNEGEQAGTCTCEGQCLTCEELTTNCTSCKKGTFLEENQCVEECEVGFYGDDNTQKCEECKIIGCQDCSSSTQCEQCSEDYHQNLNQNSDVACCATQCETCTTSPQICDTCTEGYYRYEQECLTNEECINKGGHYPSPDGICKECHQTCGQCNGPEYSDCTECELPKNFYNGFCCDQTCTKCTSPYANDCQECKNLYLLNTSCVEECPPYTTILQNYQYYYQNSEEMKCEPCTLHCTECIGSEQTECKQCEVGYYLLNGHCEKCSDSCDECLQKGDDKCISCSYPSQLSSDAQNNGGYCCVQYCELCEGPNDNQCLKCEKGASLQDGVCKQNCDSGYFENNGVCIKCHESCKECNNSLEQNCTECLSPRHLFNGFCCDETCDKCSGPLKTNCINCVNELYFIDDNSSCVKNCPTGYYLNESQCRKCNETLGEDCFQCDNSTNCTKCYDGIIDNGNCVSYCDPDKYYNPETLQCLPCINLFGNECEECKDNKDGCTKCINDYYLSIDEQECVTNCNETTYPDANDMKCKNCQDALENCEECENKAECQKCVKDYYLDYITHLCVNKCPDGQTIDINNNTKCDICSNIYDEKCSECNSTQCIKCSNDLYLSEENCVSNCPPGTYKNTLTIICDDCSIDCSTCSESPENCTSCEGELYYYSQNNSCIKECPDGYVKIKEENLCKLCGDAIENCEQCLNETECEKCIDGKYLDPITKNCEDKCPTGYYENDNDICSKCSEIFGEQCSDCEKGNCLECQEPQILDIDKQKCISEDDCIKNNNNWINQTNSAQCTPCSETINNCEECLSQIQCINCSEGKYLSSDGRQCLDDCSSQTDSWQDDFNKKCIKCEESLGSDCIKCENAEKCINCETGILRNDKCEQPCEADKYYNEIDENCQPCTDIFGEQCSECYNNGQQCIKCSSNYYLTSDSQKCVEECNSTTYPDTSTMQCKKCDEALSNCEECSNSSQCLVCASGFMDYNTKKCVSQCPNGQLISEQNPKECDLCSNEYGSQCISCSSTKCTQCSDGLYATEQGCTSSCPSGTFRNSVSMLCEQCSSNCKQCDYSSDYCTSCESPQFLTSGNKCKECSSGTFHDSSDASDPDKCSPCGANCEECYSSTSCRSCENPYWITGNGDCVTEFDCPDDQYIDEENKACKNCQTGYKVNSSQTGCTKIQCGELCELCLNNSYCFECQSGNKTNITLDEETGKCIDWNDIADIDCSDLVTFNLQTNTQNLSNLTMEDILCYSQKIYASYHGENKWVCNRTGDCQNDGKCYGRSTQSCMCVDGLWGQDCKYQNFTLMQQNLKDIVGLIVKNSKSSWMRYQLILAKSLEYLIQVRNVWNEELCLNVLTSMEKLEEVLSIENYFEISEILVKTIGHEMSVIIEDGNLQDNNNNNQSISSNEQLSSIFERIQTLVDTIATRQMLSLNDEQNSNLMVTPEIEVFVLYIDKNAKGDATINETNDQNVTTRRRLFSINSINKTEASQYISFSDASINYFNNVIDIYAQDFFIKVIAYQSNKFTQIFLDKLDFKTGVTTFTIYKGQAGLLETVQMQPISEPILLYIKKTDNEQFSDQWKCFAFDSNNTLNKTGKAIYMNSDEYVSCELFYLKNEFSSFSVAVELGQEAGAGLPLWATILIILGALLILLLLLFLLLRNKHIRERLKQCCKKKISEKVKLTISSNSSSLQPNNPEEALEIEGKSGSSNSDPDNNDPDNINRRRKIPGIKGINDADFYDQQLKISEGPNKDDEQISEITDPNDPNNIINNKKKNQGIRGLNDADFFDDGDQNQIIHRIGGNKTNQDSDIDNIPIGASTKIPNLKNQKQRNDNDDVDEINGKKKQNKNKIILPPVYDPKKIRDEDVEELQDNTKINAFKYSQIGQQQNPNDVDSINDALQIKGKVFQYNKKNGGKDFDDTDIISGQQNDPLKLKNNNKQKRLYQDNDADEIIDQNNMNFYLKNNQKNTQNLDDVDIYNDQLQANFNLNQKQIWQNNENNYNIDELKNKNDMRLKINLNKNQQQNLGNSIDDVPEINSDMQYQLNYKNNKQNNNFMNNPNDVPSINQDGLIQIAGVNIQQQKSLNNTDEELLDLNSEQQGNSFQMWNQQENDIAEEGDDGLQNQMIDSTRINLNLQQKNSNNKNYYQDENDVQLLQMQVQDADEYNIVPLQFQNDYDLDEKDDIENLASNIFKMYQKRTGQQNLKDIDVEEIKNEILGFFQMASMGEIDAFQHIDFNNIEQIDNKLFTKMCNYLNMHIFKKKKKQQMIDDNEVEENQQLKEMDVQIQEVPLHFFAEEKLKSNLVIQALQSQNFQEFCQSQEIINLENLNKNNKLQEFELNQSIKVDKNAAVTQEMQQMYQQSQKLQSNISQKLNQVQEQQITELQMSQSKVIAPGAQKLMDNFYSKLLSSLQAKDQQRKATNSSVFGMKSQAVKLPQKQIQKKYLDSIEQQQQNFMKSGANAFRSQMPYQQQQRIITEEKEEEEDEILKNLPNIKQEQGLQSIKYKAEAFHKKQLVHAGLKSANQEKFLNDLNKGKVDDKSIIESKVNTDKKFGANVNKIQEAK